MLNGIISLTFGKNIIYRLINKSRRHRCIPLKRLLPSSASIAVMVDAFHHCVSSRGVSDPFSTTVTTEFRGKLLMPEIRAEFLKMVEI